LRVTDGLSDFIHYLFTSSTPVSTLIIDGPTSYYYTGIPVNLGYIGTQNIYILKQDNKKGFFIESGIPVNSSGGYTLETFTNAKKIYFLKLLILATPKQVRVTMSTL
ncbi:hypothetical protein DX143_14025, partial [Listeria monocytogenes]|nr:hypothetical protein [Listeria monocytogenes]